MELKKSLAAVCDQQNLAKLQSGEMNSFLIEKNITKPEYIYSVALPVYQSSYGSKLNEYTIVTFKPASYHEIHQFMLV